MRTVFALVYGLKKSTLPEMPPTIAEIERTRPPFYDEEANAVHYPDSDGKPMADNTRQFRYISTLKGGFDAYYHDRDDVFVAGDLLWYPVEGDNKTRFAPDVMIAFGRPPGDRGSYKQWLENGQPPNVVFEVLSPGNTPKEMKAKLEAYDGFGVGEYYEYDPDKGELRGWLRDPKSGHLERVENMQGWRSPATEVTMRLEGKHLVVTRPDGKVFLTHADDHLRAENAEHRAEQERERARKLARRLQELGEDPDAL